MDICYCRRSKPRALTGQSKCNGSEETVTAPEHKAREVHVALWSADPGSDNYCCVLHRLKIEKFDILI